jgi:eukaryotic-like serine/threonine-protein kinase
MMALGPVTPSGAESVERPKQDTNAEARIGEVLMGRWALDALLGVGGMGKVYAATHRNGKRVAIKIMHEHLCKDGDLAARFVREGYVANRIVHPRAVSILDDGKTSDGVPFLVMDLLQGESVGERMRREGSLPQDLSLQWLDQILEVLAIAHQQGIVHRDIKPDNVFITREGEAHVLDFGLAKVREETTDVLRTLHGIPIGTLGFMPPEQALGQVTKIKPSSDVWSVAATVVTMLTGKRVHERTSKVDEVFLAMTSPVENLAERISDPALVPLLERALTFSQELRFTDAAAFRTALRHACPALGQDLARVVSPLLALRSPSIKVPAIATERTLPLNVSPVAIERDTPGGRWITVMLVLVALVVLAILYAILT